jgi:hypothetical protein
MSFLVQHQLLHLFKALTSLRTEAEEKLFQKLLQEIMVCLVTSFPIHDAIMNPGPVVDDAEMVDDTYSFFPSQNRIRKERPYQADQGLEETPEDI